MCAYYYVYSNNPPCAAHTRNGLPRDLVQEPTRKVALREAASLSRGLPAVPAACLGATSRHFLSCATPSCNRPASVYRSHFCTACVHTAIPSSPRPSTHLPRRHRHRPPRPLPWVASRAPPTPALDACVLSPSHSTASPLPPPCTYNNSPSLSHCPRARTLTRFCTSAPPATSSRFLRHSHHKPDRRKAIPL